MYLSTDRPEIQFAVKEACREMAKPCQDSWKMLERVAKYLKARPRAVWLFSWQAAQQVVDAYGDSNWAGCRKTRKSTSGGAIMLGSHCIKTWSKTQALIAKSSAEAELYGAVRAACEVLGFQTLMEDMGVQIDARTHIDASAAKSIIEREGLGKLRHVHVNVLWLQEQEVRRRLPLAKIDGKINCADLMTKHLQQQDMEMHIETLNIKFRDGRAQKSPELYNIFTRKGVRDEWREEPGKLTRIHKRSRCALFTPLDVVGPKGGAGANDTNKKRTTKGTFENGTEFEILDHWTAPACARRCLPMKWTGTTTFTTEPNARAQTTCERQSSIPKGHRIEGECEDTLGGLAQDAKQRDSD